MVPSFRMEHGAQLRGISLTRASPSALPIVLVMPFNTIFFSMIFSFRSVFLHFIFVAASGAGNAARVLFSGNPFGAESPRTVLQSHALLRRVASSHGSAHVFFRPRDDLGLLRGRQVGEVRAVAGNTHHEVPILFRVFLR